MKRINEKTFLITGILLKTVYFIINLVIGGNHIDEVMTSLNANSLAKNLTDIAGEKLPVYFDTWLVGGQSPLATYLTSLSVNIFGNSLFGIRFPTLIVSIAGFIAFFVFIKEIIPDNKQRVIIMGISCISPWLVFSSTYLLDCNYIAHMTIIAFCFIAKAINTKKVKYYVFSMLFFSLGFYSYMASVLLIPAVLIAMYSVLLLKKKIGFKETAISVGSIFAFSLPFILSGLVVIGLIPEFKLFGFSFSEMPYYTRASSVAFSEIGVLNYFETGFINLIQSCILIFIPESLVAGIGLNIFFYSNLFGGLFLAITAYELVKSAAKKDEAFTFNQKLFSLTFVIGIVFFCFNVNRVILVSAYRYGILTYMLLFFEGIGISFFAKRINKDGIKLFIVYVLISFAIFNAEFFGKYVSDVKSTPSNIYGDSLYDCFDYYYDSDIDSDRIVIIEDSLEKQYRASVYCRDYYMNSDMHFVKINKEFEERYMKELGKNYSEVKLTEDDYIKLCSYEEIEETDNCCYVVTQSYAKSFDGYESKCFGYWTIIYKK